MEQTYETWYLFKKMEELPIIYGNNKAIMGNERETEGQLANCGVLLDMLHVLFDPKCLATGHR